MPMLRDQSLERVFFALWPPAEVRQQIAQVAARLPFSSGSRRLAPDNLHMTLHFIGNLPPGRIDCMVEQARHISCSPFTLELGQTGFFGKPRVAWMGCSQVPPQLGVLHAQLATRLAACDYVAETRPFQPHVTLARKVDEHSPSRCQPVEWWVDGFALVRSANQQGGVHYSPRNWFELAG